MKKIVIAALGAAAASCSIALAAPAAAIPPGPNTCVGGWGPFGSYKDCDLWPDGSFWHTVSGGFIGGIYSEGRVCDGFPVPPATDNDPKTPCPGV